MKKILTLAFIFILSRFAFAQNVKFYSEGDLTIDDFKGDAIDLDSLGGTAYFDQILVSEPMNSPQGIKLTMEVYKAFIYTNKSWLSASFQNEYTIPYFQILFDLEHLACQRKNKYIFENQNNINNNQLYFIEQEKNIDIEKFVAESLGGQRVETLIKWKNSIKEELNKYQYSSNIDHVQYYSKWGMDITFGAGKVINSSADLKNLIANPWGISFSINTNLNNNYIILSGLIGIAKTDMTQLVHPFWDQNISVNYSIFNIAYGKSFQLTNHIKIIPFIGPSFANLALANPNQYEGRYASTSDTQWKIGGGMMIDYSFSKKYGYSGGGFQNNFKIYQEHAVRLMVNMVSSNENFNTGKNLPIATSLNYSYYFGSLNQK